MPPSKASRNNHDESKAETAAAREKNGGHSTATKARRTANQNAASHREAAAAGPTSAPAQASSASAAAPSIDWSSFDREALHAYRREHRLNTPNSFKSPYHQWVLSRAGGVGTYSPTMVRRRQSRRQGKDQLALAVRKHFNGVGIQENDVIVEFLAKLREEDASKVLNAERRRV